MCARRPGCSCQQAIDTAPKWGHGHRMAAQCERRHEMALRHAAQREARKAAPVPMPEVREVYDQDAIWLTVTGLLMIGILIAFAWVVLP